MTTATMTTPLSSSLYGSIVFAVCDFYGPIDYDAVVHRSTFLLIFSDVDCSFSIVFDCAVDDIVDGCWQFVVLHYYNLDQTMNSYRCAAISWIYTCFDSISLSINYRQMHKILVHYLRNLKTTLSRWNQIQINLSVFIFLCSMWALDVFWWIIFFLRRDGFILSCRFCLDFSDQHLWSCEVLIFFDQF